MQKDWLPIKGLFRLRKICNQVVQHGNCILPVNDIKEHRESYVCHCLPEVKNESGNMIVVHNSFDGREGVEWVNEILND